MNQPAAVDIKGLENVQDLLNGQVPVQGPQDYVEILLAGFQTI